MKLQGTSFIGNRRGRTAGKTFRGSNPSTGEALEPTYWMATEEEVDEAAELAATAFLEYRRLSGDERSRFLREIADRIDDADDVLVACVGEETGLPNARVRMETGRTTSQLRMFANLVQEGSWVDARLDRPEPDRKPIPKPDLRFIHRPLGPVAVFGASNFPMAFSVAGGDTAAALAAGCTVVVKAHCSHPRTSEIVAEAIIASAQECGLPDGTFSLVYGTGPEAGQALVSHPRIRAVGFTGSRAAGRAIMDAAAARPEPIPVYTEMSSVNPIFILPGALRERPEQIAQGLHGSVTLGVGQFCTNPGLVFLPASDGLEAFHEALSELIRKTPTGVMLNDGISKAYRSRIEEMGGRADVEILAVTTNEAPNACPGDAALLRTTLESFLSTDRLSTEIFGPATLLVVCNSTGEFRKVLDSLEGQLTASLFAESSELDELIELAKAVELKAGRLLFNQFPTGVEVCSSMVHGGPYPATSDGKSTSVGTAAIYRFTRPVCFQNFPAALLPPDLQDANPLRIRRLVDGEPEGDFRGSYADQAGKDQAASVGSKG